MPQAIDLFCGLGGWAEGLLAEGWDVIGFDIEAHRYGDHRYPAKLVIQDVLTLHGSQFRNAGLIVASPPCQAYSYRAMPWSRAKALPPPDNTLFETCFRIQREACHAAGRHIPMVVENVRGAQKWVGRARWNYGSFYLWGDVPALMPLGRHTKHPGMGAGWQPPGHPNHRPGLAFNTFKSGEATKLPSFQFDGCGSFQSASVRRTAVGNDERFTSIKQGGSWFGPGNPSLMRQGNSESLSRKAASALIAKIPLPLARHIAAVYR
jgi:hypothetical protein